MPASLCLPMMALTQLSGVNLSRTALFVVNSS